VIIGISSLAWQETDDLEAILQGTASLGFRGVEINLGSREAPLERMTRHYSRRISRRARQLGVRLAAHAPALDLNPISGNRLVRRLTFDQYREALHAARELGAQFMTVHLGVLSYPGFDRGEARRLCLEFYRRLLDAHPWPAPVIALENVGWGHRDPFLQVEDYLSLLDDLADPRAGFTLDVGHGFLAGLDMAALVRGLGPRLVNVHVHDNDGVEDWHRPLGEGVVDVAAVVRALEEAGYQGFLTFEHVSSRPPQAAVLHRIWARAKGPVPGAAGREAPGEGRDTRLP